MKEKQQLKDYLSQYYISKRKKVQLEGRLNSIRKEMDTANHNMIAYRVSEIEDRITQQKEQVEKALLRVMDIMDFLQENSTERMIMELRFIDCKQWRYIEGEMHLSRSSCFSYQDKALEQLLTFKKVQAILRERE